MRPELVAPVVPIDSSSVTPNVRERRLEAAYRDTYDDLVAALRDAELVPPFGSQQQTPIGTLLDQLRKTVWALGAAWQTRTRRAEGVMARALATHALSDDQRRTILTTMYGRPGVRRDAAILSDAERTMIGQYRQLDDEDRRMLRTLFARMVATTGARESRAASRRRRLLEQRENAGGTR